MTQQSTGSPTTGIRSPDEPDRWLVVPWPARASFSEVVRHFVSAYMGSLQSNTNAAHQLTYFEGYQAALEAARTHELTSAVAWQWRDELLVSIAECIAIFRNKRRVEIQRAKGNVRQLQPGAMAAIPGSSHLTGSCNQNATDSDAGVVTVCSHSGRVDRDAV